MAFLGSGAYTSELLIFLSQLDVKRFSYRIYLLNAEDANSDRQLRNFEKFCEPFSSYQVENLISHCSFWRKVLKYIHYLRIHKPDILICNGPNSCIPCCIAAFIAKFCFISHTSVVFLESYCRVTRLSPTGKLLYYSPFVDSVIVQWPSLVELYRQTDYIGWIK
ncbi:putative UDP-N-acetylglucosamine transferase subunit ALG14 [Monocercomonoides exilis]|uniref:putative UDP-N-acetylglucosamine transferase subunit ALG14 n=1 Tax=Monocercomonoides exilis TaxID=2049356 RepID=UPI003559AA73|nr:putative UDP-N-acetylglucosamine transferase subunit ALG14 [Monocercomonoides exilis]